MSPAPHDYGVSDRATFPDSAPFPDFVTTNPFRDQSQAELDRISRNIFGDNQPAEFRFASHLQVPTSQASQMNCVSPAAMMNSSSSVVSNTSPPRLTESFHSSSSPGFYDGQTPGDLLQTNTDAMFLDFEQDASAALAQEADLLTLDGIGAKGYGDFGVDVDVDPADISLFNNEEGNSWLL